jgi:flagellar biosynthesis/type III secretory pathway chaperone
VDASLCRETLAGLLSSENDSLSTLIKMLEHEHEVLLANDVAQLETAIAQRQDSMGAIVRLEEERNSLCRMLGYDSDLPGLQQLMAWCDAKGVLRSSWEQCAKLATLCRELNQRNSALVSLRLKRVGALLGVLTGKEQQSAIYDASGVQATPRAARLLITQA